MRLAVKVHGDKGGAGDVVLIHGTGARAEMWTPQIKLLEDLGYRCIVPDLRGHGESEDSTDRMDINAHLNDIVDTLEHCDLQYPAVFAGHSLGSIISLELAAQRPELISKILAAAMPGRVPAITVLTFRAFLGAPFHAIKGSIIHKNLAWRERVLLDTSHNSLKQIVDNFADLNYVENLPAVQCPVHFVVGRLDPIAPARHVELMHKQLPNSSLQIIEWAGHNCMDSQPEPFNRWFLQKLAEK
ncbi:MAG: alpha/beta hydrolase [Candidatus Obscuribacterales bacterium]|nr:alpha/beta hydrolase [Candidatus Obscuribacterales bacterium]